MILHRKILLAEDDPNDIELTLIALEEYQLHKNVVIAKNGVEALDYLYRRGQYADCKDPLPQLILLDNKMPKMTGLDVLQTIKADPILKKIPVVMLSSSKEDRDIFESYALGVNAYVVKPMIFDEFIQAVQCLSRFWIYTNQAPIL